jgi:hypothetical protein
MDSLHEADSEFVPNDVEYGRDASRDLRVSFGLGRLVFKVVEEITQNEGTWSYAKDAHTLTVDGPDISGILRFMGRLKGSKNPVFFLVVLGNDTDTWCDLHVNLQATDSGAPILQRYYDSGTSEHSIKQHHQKTVTRQSTTGAKITVTVSDQVLVVNIHK